MYGMGSLGSGLDDGGAGMNPQTMTKDPKLLTKSTINNDGPPNQHQFQYGGNQLGVQHSASFGPAGGPPGAGGQPLGPGGMDMQQMRAAAGFPGHAGMAVGAGMAPQGYVSDYYKNKMGMGLGGMGPTSDDFQAQANGHMGMHMQNFVGADLGSNPHANGLNPINNQKLTQMLDNQANIKIDPSHQLNFKQQNKISSNKFFKSKIDFTAPIKSLQLQQNADAMQNNLSDDS